MFIIRINVIQYYCLEKYKIYVISDLDSIHHSLTIFINYIKHILIDEYKLGANILNLE